jgi:hypothetical protein
MTDAQADAYASKNPVEIRPRGTLTNCFNDKFSWSGMMP